VGKCKGPHLGWDGKAEHWAYWRLSGSLGEKCSGLVADKLTVCKGPGTAGCSVTPVE